MSAVWQFWPVFETGYSYEIYELPEDGYRCFECTHPRMRASGERSGPQNDHGGP